MEQKKCQEQGAPPEGICGAPIDPGARTLSGPGLAGPSPHGRGSQKLLGAFLEPYADGLLRVQQNAPIPLHRFRKTKIMARTRNGSVPGAAKAPTTAWGALLYAMHTAATLRAFAKAHGLDWSKKTEELLVL